VTLQNAYDVGGTNTGTRGVSGVSPFSVGTVAKSGKVVSGSGGTIAFFNDDFIYAALEALRNEGNARVVARPRVLVNNNAEAFIDSSREKPTTKTSFPTGSDVPIVEFDEYVKAGTKLSITPHISEGKEGRPDFLRLEISMNVDNFEGEGSESIPPAKTINQIETDITIPDDSTIILGGLTRTIDSIKVSKIPLLGDIPLVGVLFRNVNRAEETSVLYVFVKASVVNEPGFGDLKGISQTSDVSLRDMEANYQQQTIIPGLSLKTGSLKNSALDSYEIAPQKDADIKDEE
jgi:type II secretory pathway component GspD/PulD (secretin)